MDGVNSPKTPTEKTALHPCPPSPPWEAQSSQEALHPRGEGLARAALGALLAHTSRISELVEREQQNGGNHPDTAFRSPPDLSIRAKPSSRPLSRVPMWLAPPVRPAAPSCPRAARGMRGWTPALGPRTRRTEGPGDSPISLSPRQAVSPRQSWTGEAEQASRTHLRPTYFEKLQENHQHIEPKLQGWPGGARALGPTRSADGQFPSTPGPQSPPRAPLTHARRARPRGQPCRGPGQPHGPWELACAKAQEPRPCGGPAGRKAPRSRSARPSRGGRRTCGRGQGPGKARPGAGTSGPGGLATKPETFPPLPTPTSSEGAALGPRGRGERVPRASRAWPRPRPR